MKRIFSRAIVAVWLLSQVVLGSWAANTKSQVVQVTTSVDVAQDLDYIITGVTPFGEQGVVNLVNTEHAVLILNQVRPSEAMALLASHVKINGERAVNNNNCQVKLYNRGCIILPYAASLKPLTVYSEPNFGGESVNDFGLESSGGFMNTLSDAKLNNRIRSFKLKRGYMVTFSLRAAGRGYSRCFIADDADLEVASLPAVMDQKISSYRVFKWYDTGKASLANDTRAAAVSALHVTSCYSFGLGESRLPDAECVPHHIYEDWPSPSACGQVTYSPHLKTNNEPRNSADDHPQDLTTILNNWENLMATGQRLCSPSSWDGSDYWNGTGFLKQFFDSIDARGWRCDILDMHCYWVESNFPNLQNWLNAVHRPIWISEWCWGASWNRNGAFANGVTETQVRSALQNICSRLNSYDYVERYYYWNSEQDISKIYKDGTLTPAGQYYSTINSGLGYNGKYDYVPTTPKQYGPSKFSKTVAGGKVRLTWYDANGEFNQLMEVQYKNASGQWVSLDRQPEQKETASNYIFDIDNPDETVDYRVHLIDLNGKEYFTSDDFAAGDLLDVDGKSYYVGGNVFGNGDFDLGLLGWTSGTGEALTEPQFQAVAAGGYDGGAYLQAHKTGAIGSDASLKQVVSLQPGQNYYVRAAVLNGNTGMKISLSTDGTAESEPVLTFKAGTAWDRPSATFNAGTYDKALVSFKTLGAKAQMDKIELRQLFESREAAVADGVEKARSAAQLVQEHNTKYPQLNSELASLLAGIATTDDAALAQVEQAVAGLQQGVAALQAADSLKAVLDGIASVKCGDYDEILSYVDAALKATTAEAAVTNVAEAKALIARYLDFSDAAVQPKSPSFRSTDGWETVTGTYKGGDQRTNTVGGKTCWNAWWSVAKATNPGATMGIRQTISDLPGGIYTLECKATTEHFCLSDQHAYLEHNGQTAVTQPLAYDYFDLPVGNIWQTLATTPLYVEDGGSVTIGFESSKEGATDGKWHSFGNASATGDNREGWWCATDFVLKYHPVYKRNVAAGQWGTICLPYNVRPSEGLKFYQIVGITSDYTKLCLSEISETQAGVPCIYQATSSEAVFAEYGEPVTSPTDGTGNLRGFFVTSAKLAQGYFYLDNGTWVKVTSSNRNERPSIESYSAYIRSFTDVSSKQIPVIDSWDELTMPITGVTDEEKAANGAGDTDAVSGVYNGPNRPDGIYRLDGRQAKAGSQMRQGIYIKVENGKAQKAVSK